MCKELASGLTGVLVTESPYFDQWFAKNGKYYYAMLARRAANVKPFQFGGTHTRRSCNVRTNSEVPMKVRNNVRTNAEVPMKVRNNLIDDLAAKTIPSPLNQKLLKVSEW